MNVGEIYDILKDTNVRELSVQSVISNLEMIKAIDEKEYTAMIRARMCREFSDKFARDVFNEADWHTQQTANGLQFSVRAFVLPQRQMFELVGTAYRKGQLYNPPLEFFK